MNMKDALEVTGEVDTMVLANACMTGDACRDVRLAKNLLTAMHKFDMLTVPGEHGAYATAFMIDLATVGFFAKYGQAMIANQDSPSRESVCVKFCRGIDTRTLVEFTEYESDLSPACMFACQLAYRAGVPRDIVNVMESKERESERRYGGR